MTDPLDNDTELEQQLTEAFRNQAVAPGVQVPDRVNSAILAAIAAKSTSIKQSHWRAQRFRRFTFVAAAAAALLFCFFGALHVRHEATPASSLAVAPAAASVDIVDAYRLACAIRSRQTQAAHHDFNRDGRVDHADVDALARQAVRIAPTTKEEENHG